MRNWDDLTVRLATAAVLAIICLVPLVLGGNALKILTAILGGIMIWELLVMLIPEKPLEPSIVGYLAIAALYLLDDPGSLAGMSMLAAVLLLGFAVSGRHRVIFLAYGLVILGGCVGLFALRQEQGLVWVMWLVLVVIASDVGGYFTGRTLGGPKFWPRVSPKKTWSGIIGGWLLAALVGLAFVGPTGGGAGLILASMALAFASQLGDIAESAIKRYAGVKDSSHLLPGHGGFLDRFDGLLPVAFAWLLFRLSSGNVPGLN